MNSSIFVVIAAYADADLPHTLDSAIRAASGQHLIHISVLEEATRYAEAYAVGRYLPEHITLSIGTAGEDVLLGIGGARHLAESKYDSEEFQVQVDAHTRFVTHWDDYVVRLITRLGKTAVVSTGHWPNPWTDSDKVPVVRFDRIENGLPAGHVEMLKPVTLGDTYPARTVLGHSIMGASWCQDVPSDPHIMFGGDEYTLSTRLWTHGRTLLHARMPWYQAAPGERLPGRPYERPGWSEKNEISQRRVNAILTGVSLEEGDPAGVDLEKYGLRDEQLAAWIEYSGLDYRAGTVSHPWPPHESS